MSYIRIHISLKTAANISVLDTEEDVVSRSSFSSVSSSTASDETQTSTSAWSWEMFLHDTCEPGERPAGLSSVRRALSAGVSQPGRGWQTGMSPHSRTLVFLTKISLVQQQPGLCNIKASVPSLVSQRRRPGFKAAAGPVWDGEQLSVTRTSFTRRGLGISV